jgi:hypothetical protein
MTFVTSNEIGPYNPSPHALLEPGSKNPYRTPTEETREARERPWMSGGLEPAYPRGYRGFRIDLDPVYQHLKRAFKPDGKLLGTFIKQTDYEGAINAFIRKQEELEAIRREAIERRDNERGQTDSSENANQ